MNKFLRGTAALGLTVVLLTTGCAKKDMLMGLEMPESSESITSETDTESSPDDVSSSPDSNINSSSGDNSSSDGTSPVVSEPVSEPTSTDDNSSAPESSSGTGNSVSSGSGGTGNSGNGGSANSGAGNNGNSGSGSTDNSANGINFDNSGSSGSGSGGSVTSGFEVSWNAGNSWDEGGNKCGTVEMKVINNSGKSVSGWKISFTVPSGFSITNGWNGTYSVSGTTATVTNAEYNGEIPAGGNVTIGFNYSSPTVFTPPSSVSFNGTAGSSSSNNGVQNNNNGNNNNQGSDQNQNDPAPSEDVTELLKRTEKAVQGDDWLHTDGNKILDKNGKQVWLTGVNWFGYNTGTNTFDGLWNSQMRSTVKGIADHGFNLIRVPISAELLNQWSRGEYPKANYNNAYNPEMNAMNSLQIFDYFLTLAEENGLKVMPDIHCAETNAMGHNVNLWYTDKVSVEDYYHALEWLADRYKNNDTIIAIDIKNEPHGKPNEGSSAAIWNNSKDKNNWKYTAEQAAARILAKNPNVLIMVEGTEIYSKKNGSYTSTNSADYYFNWWGGNLRGVRDYPVDLGKYQNKLVYSPHDYGPTVYEQPWFQGGFDYNSLIRDCWQDNWLYIQKENIAPLLIGEWGGFMREPNLKWMTCMRQLIKEYHLNHTFWCYNANSGDTGGLVLDDFSTWDTEKYNFVKEVLWQEGGKFVGLDHAIPLGANGISVSNAKGL